MGSGAPPAVRVSIRLGSSYDWPDGTPTASELLPDGRMRHTLASGVKVTVPAFPTMRIEYLSSWVGADDGETYDVMAALTGRTIRSGFYEVWNYDSSKLRNYSFAKTVRVHDLCTGQTFTGIELEAALAEACQHNAP